MLANTWQWGEKWRKTRNQILLEIIHIIVLYSITQVDVYSNIVMRNTFVLINI